jgi:hypothetical protein
MLEVARLVFNYYNLSIPSYIDKTKAHYDFTEYVVPVIFGFSAIAFLGFSAWFMHAVYRLRSHSKARWRFLQLVIFSFVAALTFTIEFSRIMRLNMEGQTSSNFAVNELLFFETANFTSTAIRSFICLAVLGIAWPTDSTNTGASSTNQAGIHACGVDWFALPDRVRHHPTKRLILVKMEKWWPHTLAWA